LKKKTQEFEENNELWEEKLVYRKYGNAEYPLFKSENVKDKFDEWRQNQLINMESEKILKVRFFIESQLERRLNVNNLIQELRDGVTLCELANSVKANTIPKIHKTQHILHKLENIILFLKACKTLGVDENQIFSEWDLLEMRNMEKVYDCILELSTITYNLMLKKKSLK